MEKEYYYVSEEIIIQFPELIRSKAINRGFNKKGYIVEVTDFEKIKEYVESLVNPQTYVFAYQIVDSQVKLTYTGIDFDDEDNEVEVPEELDIETCRREGLVKSIEEYLNISKEQNIAYAIYKLTQKYKVNPLDLIDKLLYTV